MAWICTQGQTHDMRVWDRPYYRFFLSLLILIFFQKLYFNGHAAQSSYSKTFTSLTWTQNALMASTGEVITFAVHAIDFAKLWLIAAAVVTAAFPTPTAHLFAFSFTAGGRVRTAYFFLFALAVGAMVAWVTAACATGVGAHITAVVALGLSKACAVTITLIIHRDFQTIFKAYRLNGETFLGAWTRTAMGSHTYVEGDLKRERKIR